LLAIFGISRSRANLDHRSLGTETASGAVANPIALPEKRTPAASPGTPQVGPAPDDRPVTAASPEDPAQPSGAATVDLGAASATSESEVKTPNPALPVRARNLSMGPSAADAKKMLGEAEQLLRAQRFSEAREVFTKLAKAKATRGRALVALAEIAFQEKNYEETIRSANLAAERGGGARARVLLGDAHFRLNHFEAAATAYGQALRLDPGNPSAVSGLALASKRM
jgi:predicted Zn-dependent protease